MQGKSISGPGRLLDSELDPYPLMNIIWQGSANIRLNNDIC